jgi:squalene-hopene/tetraprenyl-beta-curcumene cyclase
MLRVRLTVMLAACAAHAMAAGWDPKLAAKFLDERQKQWFEWPVAAKKGGPCVSCHTGLTYLIARPALRRVLNESEPTKWETGLLDSLRARLDGPLPGTAQAVGTESVLAAVLMRDNAAAQDRMWRLQLKDGKRRGAWNWFELEMDPWENTEAPFFGAALAALTPGASRSSELMEYLKTAAAEQPLQNRLTLLWTAKPLAKKEWIDEAFAKQSSDGGWSAEAIGPWKARPTAPPVSGSNSYATAYVAFTLIEGGVKASDARMKRALDWLRARQDKTYGYWDAVSMNKRFEPGSMQEQFMRDAATAFAAAALVKAESN